MDLAEELLTRFEEAAIDRYRSLQREGRKITVDVKVAERYDRLKKDIIDILRTKD